MLRFYKTKIAKADFDGAKKRTIKVWNAYFNNTAMSKSVKVKNNLYLI